LLARTLEQKKKTRNTSRKPGGQKKREKRLLFLPNQQEAGKIFVQSHPKDGKGNWQELPRQIEIGIRLEKRACKKWDQKRGGGGPKGAIISSIATGKEVKQWEPPGLGNYCKKKRSGKGGVSGR